MEKTSLILRYKGPSITREGMEAKYVADSIRGFSDFLSRIGHEIHGERARQKTMIQAVKPGSIEIEFLQMLTDGTVQLAMVTSADAYAKYADFIKSCFGLFKHLGGKPAKSMNYEGDMGCQVQNEKGNNTIVNIGTFNIVMDPRTGSAAKKFGNKPLSSVANILQVLEDDEVIAEANSDDAACFVGISSEETLIDQVVEMVLVVVSPVFQGQGKWKFFDGQGTISAKIEDEVFQSEINAGIERFGKDDILHASVRTVQKKTPSGLKAEHTIMEVLEHHVASDRSSKLL
ncbi:MAG: hypothetical protein ACYYKD_10875 [Rhodospirillales bacterium]